MFVQTSKAPVTYETLPVEKTTRVVLGKAGDSGTAAKELAARLTIEGKDYNTGHVGTVTILTALKIPIPKPETLSVLAQTLPVANTPPGMEQTGANTYTFYRFKSGSMDIPGFPSLNLSIEGGSLICQPPQGMKVAGTNTVTETNQEQRTLEVPLEWFTEGPLSTSFGGMLVVATPVDGNGNQARVGIWWRDMYDDGSVLLKVLVFAMSVPLPPPGPTVPPAA